MLNSFWWGSNKEGHRGIHWMRWEALAIRKEHRGLGFCDLYANNLVMLGKQGWKLIFNPDSMADRILKDKYYPRGEFMDAMVGHNPSYTWCSIWSSRVLLKEGIRWRIGNSSNVHVWDHSWLCEEDGGIFKHLPTQTYQILQWQTCFYRDWRFGMCTCCSLLQPRNVNAILRVPLLSLFSEDQQFWSPRRDGMLGACRKNIRQFTSQTRGELKYVMENSYST